MSAKEPQKPAFPANQTIRQGDQPSKDSSSIPQNNVKVIEIEQIKRQLHHLIDRVEGLKTK